MTVLVTGASGFIGSYLCHHLLKRGYHVIAAARHKNKINNYSEDHFSACEMDVLNPAGFDKIEINNADAVVHTATANDIVSKNNEEAVLLSAAGTKNLLEFCVQRKIPRLIFFSTFQVYGTELNGTIDENTALRCQNDYGLNHVFGELYVEMYAREKKINGVVVRPTNVYGRLMNPHINRWTLVPACFCKEVYQTGQITLMSSGKQTRNFISLHEVSTGVEAILRSDVLGYNVYNLASGKNYSILQVAELVKICFEKRFGKKADLKIKSQEPLAGNAFHADISRLRRLGYKPDESYNLESEINQLFDHLEKTFHESHRAV